MDTLYPLLRGVLFQLPPETAHHVTFQLLKALPWCPSACLNSESFDHLTKNVMRLIFPNPLGLSAGLDKNGELLNVWDKLGFGFIEVGTVTPRPQLGNQKPRLFRLKKDKALINRLGFNNLGVDALIPRISRYEGKAILGINIGKNKDTPNENAVDDYLTCFHKVAPFADYITLNISSPNTPGLRELQKVDSLNQLLEPLKTAQAQYQTADKPLPICVKIAPDVTFEDLDMMVEVFLNHNIEGIIATNTTIDRNFNLKDSEQNEQGGLSGAPLLNKSNEILCHLKKKISDRMALIGVGGIMDSATAKTKLAQGADLLQVYTGLIYRGPGLIKEILRSLS